MELQFEKIKYMCLQSLKREMQTHEETQELRLPEDMPDIGSVLGSWGQVLMRGKEWRSGSMQMTGGVMTWVLYMPEEGGVPRCIEVWLPFQLRWELPDTKTDGKIVMRCMLRSVDARSTSARKLIVRATVSALGEALVSQEIEVPKPMRIPEDVYICKREHTVQLPVEAGERAFQIDEELTLPGSCPKIKKIMRFGLQPELIDQKVMSDKVVFRGSALLHILYLSEEDSLCAWDFEIPFSQYAELDTEYGQEATARIYMAVTGLELEADPEGRLQLKTGITGQYVICDFKELETVEDGYSNCRTVVPQMDTWEIPVIGVSSGQTVHAEQTVPISGGRVVDTTFYSAWPGVERNHDGTVVNMSGQFQVLAYDEAGTLQEHRMRWEQSQNIDVDPEFSITPSLTVSGIPQASIQPGGTAVRCDLILGGETAAQRKIQLVHSMELGDITAPDPDRPGVILRRCNGETLWQLAKACGSDMDTIRTVNGITDEPVPNTMLLIPVR